MARTPSSVVEQPRAGEPVSPRIGVVGTVLASRDALLSGAPSTLHALAMRTSPLEATLAAGTLLAPRARRPAVLLLAAVPVHLALSFGIRRVNAWSPRSRW